MTKRDNWASPAELAEALKSGEVKAGPLGEGARRHVRSEMARPDGMIESTPENMRALAELRAEPKPLTTSRVMADAWDKFSAEVMPLTITPEQEKWAKRIFMAGGMTLLGNLLYSDMLDESNTDTATPQDVNRVDAIYHEMNAFFSAIGELQ